MNTWTPLWSKIVDSSLWEEPDFVVKIFITMLAKKDADDICRGNAYNISRWSKKTEPEVLEAIKILTAPDTRRVEPQPYEGRRIEKVEEGYLILNSKYYKDLMSKMYRREYQREKQSEYRARKVVTVGDEPKAFENKPMKEFTDGWMKSYQDRFHAKYDFRSTVDGPAAAALIKLDTPENLLSILGRAAAQTNATTHWNCINQTATIAQFRSALNKIRVELGRDANAPNGSVSEVPEMWIGGKLNPEYEKYMVREAQG